MSKREITFANNQNIGRIELICGCMFAGKTEEFIKRLNRFIYAKKNVIVFKPSIDIRYSEQNVESHSGISISSFPATSINEMDIIFQEQNNIKKIDVVGIDEVQFFDENVVEYINKLSDQGIIVIVTGLDKDFKNNAFKNVDKLLVISEVVDKLLAICTICGNLANCTQRIVNGLPAKANEPIILVDGADSYEARCRKCYLKPE